MKNINFKKNTGFTQLVDFGDAPTFVGAHKNASPKFTTGFTIIETMISISVFLVVIMIGVDSLLNASLLHQKSKDKRSAMDNLTFIMDDMSKNIRTGYHLRCVVGVFNPLQAQGVTGNTPQSCEGGDGGAIVFENVNGLPAEGGDQHTEDQWVYKIESGDTGLTYDVWKSVDGAENFVKLNADEVKLYGSSGFIVSGADPSDNQQPLTTIKLIGKVTTRGSVSSFAVQTTVSQRSSD